MGKITPIIARNHAGETKGHAQVRMLRHSRWTQSKRVAFLEELAVTSNVTAAAEAAGMSRVQLYRIKKRDPAFGAAWAEALREGYQALEIQLLERARNGTEKPVFFGGKQIDTTREFNDAVALKLLSAHRDAVAAERTAERPEAAPRETALAEIKAKLAEMSERRAALEADRASDDDQAEEA